MVSNYQCAAFVNVIYYLFQTKCLFLNVHCQSLLQLFLFEIPKGSLGLIFAVRTQIMRTRTWRCVQSSNKWTSKDSASQLQQAFMPIKWLILQEFKHCSILIFNLGCILGLKTQAATKVWKQWNSVRGFNKSRCWALRSAFDSERESDHSEGNCQWQANHETSLSLGKTGIDFRGALEGKMLFCKQCCSFETGLKKEFPPDIFTALQLWMNYNELLYPILSFLNRFWYIPWYW